MLAAEMDIDPEYASLLCLPWLSAKAFWMYFRQRLFGFPVCRFWTVLRMISAKRKKYIKSAHNFENDILVASRNIAKRYSSSKNHIQGTTKLALTIFDSMKKSTEWEQENGFFFRSLSSFTDCGKYISMDRCGRMLLPSLYT